VHRVEVWCSVVQYVAVCCSDLQRVGDAFYLAINPRTLAIVVVLSAVHGRIVGDFVIVPNRYHGGTGFVCV